MVASLKWCPLQAAHGHVLHRSTCWQMFNLKWTTSLGQLLASHQNPGFGIQLCRCNHHCISWTCVSLPRWGTRIMMIRQYDIWAQANTYAMIKWIFSFALSSATVTRSTSLELTWMLHSWQTANLFRHVRHINYSMQLKHTNTELNHKKNTTKTPLWSKIWFTTQSDYTAIITWLTAYL